MNKLKITILNSKKCYHERIFADFGYIIPCILSYRCCEFFFFWQILPINNINLLFLSTDSPEIHHASKSEHTSIARSPISLLTPALSLMRLISDINCFHPSILVLFISNYSLSKCWPKSVTSLLPPSPLSEQFLEGGGGKDKYKRNWDGNRHVRSWVRR